MSCRASAVDQSRSVGSIKRNSIEVDTYRISKTTLGKTGVRMDRVKAMLRWEVEVLRSVQHLFGFEKSVYHQRWNFGQSQFEGKKQNCKKKCKTVLTQSLVAITFPRQIT